MGIASAFALRATADKSLHPSCELSVHQERESLREPDEGIADQPERVQQDGKGEADKRCLAGDREVEPAGVVAKIDGHPAVRHASGPEIVHDRPKRPKSQHFKEGGSQ
jgi:hypothetical protein